MYGCACMVSAAFAATSSPAFAAPFFSDDFNKADQVLVGTSPILSNGAWKETAPATPVQNIVSNAVSLGASGQDTYAALSGVIPNVLGNVMTTSMDISVATATATGDYFSHVTDPVGTTSLFFQRLFARAVPAGGGYQLGLVDTSGTGNTTTWGAGILPFNQTQHVDVNWTFVPGANNDTFAVLVNSLPYLTHAWTSASAEPAQITAVNLRQGSAANSATLSIDNLQVNAIVPEPASIALIVVGGVLALTRRRGR
jgi:hypothetical protein